MRQPRSGEKSQLIVIRIFVLLSLDPGTDILKLLNIVSTSPTGLAWPRLVSIESLIVRSALDCRDTY
jgi:hypothetical protein